MLTVGILGGMGPMATVDLFAKIIECTPASVDQDHLKILIYNNPQIPSRVKAILDGTESPREELIRSAQVLEKAGASLIVMPCNTAHYWYQDIQNAVKIKIINMIENTADAINAEEVKDKIMLFASDATVKTRLYQEVFLAKNICLQVPASQEQQIIAKAIDETKAGKIENNPYLDMIEDTIVKYQQTGINSFIAGCTEIPLLFKHIKKNCNKIDPTLLLAKAVVKQAFI
ncbi:Aspartate racemase [Sporomusa rhizae]|uniref:aspartate/glutamate racemase family protein n=1 Tax=Sporomusa rhizae TaxID=357999 RepID=UPI003529EA23